MTIDLHLHSTASDGALRPAELVAYAHRHGVHRMALTDHDTVAGLHAARTAANQCGMDFVDGIELSVTWRGRTLHIVGLGFTPTDAGLTAVIERLTQTRRERAEAMSHRLERFGITDALSRIASTTPQTQITRAHFARLIVEDGLARNTRQAFKRYLAPGRPVHATCRWIPLEQAIETLQRAGGLAVLAHPFGYRFTHAWRNRAISDFAAAGGDAMEVATGVSDRSQEAQALREAGRAHLLASAGSDFHAPEQRWLAPGRLRPIPPEQVIPLLSCS